MKIFDVANSKGVEISNGVNILFITLTNIGDVVLTLPSLDYLKDKFKDAKFTVLSGPNASSLFSGDPRIKENITYNKHAPLKEKISLFNHLAKQNFDVIIDLRNTAFRWFAPAKYKNPYLIRISRSIQHLRLKHLYKTISAFKDLNANDRESNPSRRRLAEADANDREYSREFALKNITIPTASICIGKDIEDAAENLLKKHSLSLNSEYIVVSPGARSLTKRWRKEGFVKICNELLKQYSIILAGDKNDSLAAQEVNKQLDFRCINLTAKTNLLEAAVILKNAKLVIGNDSAILHIASYFNKPVLAIFGPTSEEKYGPWSQNCIVARKNTLCSPCEGDNCKNDWQCMKQVSAQLVIDYANMLLNGRAPKPRISYHRILISRTDRLGDVLLSTPVIKNLRENLPSAYIAMMINSSLYEVLKANPYLDEVILFDKKGKHKGLINSIRFANSLRKRKFDLALILHPAVRVHLILFFSKIKERIGYDKKWGFLNTRILSHTKQFGEKHESEYALDFLKELGIYSFDQTIFMPVSKEAEEWAEDILNANKRELPLVASRQREYSRISALDSREFALKNNSENKIIAIHCQASCPSKLWPRDYFNRLVEDIIDIYNAKIIYVGQNRDNSIKENKNIINLTGKTSISQLASLLKRVDLFISNDSGPVHMAVALKVPVISIFGRKQPGLGPKRWGPLGAGNIFLHKDVGCEVCLAHDCKKDFSCLKAIDPKEVLAYVDKLLSR